MSESEKVCWFLEPRDAATNENAIRDLARVCNATDEHIYHGKLDMLGRRHDVVEVSWAFLEKMKRSRSTFKFNFRVFKTEGRDARMEPDPWLFHKTKQRGGAEGKRVARKLAAVAEKKAEKKKAAHAR
jgi:hypothetical protein